VRIFPLLRGELIQEIERRPIPRFRDRALRALAAMVQEVGYDLCSTLSISDGTDSTLNIEAVSYSANEKDLDVLLEILKGEGFMTVEGMNPTAIRLTPAGLIQAEEMSQPGAAYLQGFVAMSFDPSMNDAYTLGFDPGISAAGLPPFQDRREGTHQRNQR
jgi:hypothetical protein